MNDKKNNYKFTDEGTLYSKQFQDIYYSDGQGKEESLYVYLEANDVKNRLINQEYLVVAELGFGTGLNFLLCWQAYIETNSAQGFDFISFEIDLLDAELIRQAISQWPELVKLAELLIEQLPLVKTGYHQLIFDDVRLTLFLGDANNTIKQLNSKVDIWFLDGFDPLTNPEMWNATLLKSIYNASKQGTTLSTYTAKGDVRRSLKESGFHVKKIKGFAKKWHMTTAKVLVSPQIKERSPWFDVELNRLSKSQRIAVIGAGISGACVARSLAESGYLVTVIETCPKPAMKASGNPRGLVMPFISKKTDLISNFYNQAFEHSLRTLLNRNAASVVELEYGIDEIAYDQKRKERLSEGVQRFPLSFAKEIENDHYYYPNAYSLSPPALCQFYLEHERIQYQQGTLVSLEQKSAQWQLHFNDHTSLFDCVVIANAVDALKFKQCKEMPLTAVRGQIAILKNDIINSKLEKPLAHKGYACPRNGDTIIGASYDIGDTNPELRLDDQHRLIHEFNQNCPDKVDLEAALQHELSGRVGFRATTPDRLPIVGPVPIMETYQKDYSELHYGRNYEQFPKASYYSNLYISVGFGSRGLSSSSLCADIISQAIQGRVLPVSKSYLHALHPGRFIIKDLKKTPKH